MCLIHAANNIITVYLNSSVISMAPVCVGGQLELTCSVSGRVQRLSFNQSHDQHASVSPRLPSTQSLQFSGPSSQQTHHILINSVNYTYWRLSPPEVLPLVTKLMISPVNESFNGTEVICTDVENLISSSTAIFVVDKSFQGT